MRGAGVRIALHAFRSTIRARAERLTLGSQLASRLYRRGSLLTWSRPSASLALASEAVQAGMPKIQKRAGCF